MYIISKSFIDYSIAKKCMLKAYLEFFNKEFNDYLVYVKQTHHIICGKLKISDQKLGVYLELKSRCGSTYQKITTVLFASLKNFLKIVTALIGRLRHCQNIDPFSIVDFVIFTIINDIYYEARKNCFACLLFEKPMHADLNDIISCLIKH